MDAGAPRDRGQSVALVAAVSAERDREPVGATGHMWLGLDKMWGEVGRLARLPPNFARHTSFVRRCLFGCAGRPSPLCQLFSLMDAVASDVPAAPTWAELEGDTLRRAAAVRELVGACRACAIIHNGWEVAVSVAILAGAHRRCCAGRLGEVNHVVEGKRRRLPEMWSVTQRKGWCRTGEWGGRKAGIDLQAVHLREHSRASPRSRCQPRCCAICRLQRLLSISAPFIGLAGS